MPLNVRVFQIKISCYERFPEPDFGEMEGACLHTLHGPNTTACSAAFHVTRTLNLKALARSSSIFNQEFSERAECGLPNLYHEKQSTESNWFLPQP